MDTRQISQELCKFLDPDIFKVSTNLYPVISYDYFTSVFNVIYPDKDEINMAVELFEPVFIYLFSKYRDFNKIIDKEMLKEKFNNQLDVNQDGILLSKPHTEILSEYLNRFSLFRDDELNVKGWKNFIIK